MKAKYAILAATLLLLSQTAAAGLDIPSGTYKLEKTHGYITFSYSHQGYSNPFLRFRDFDITLDLDADDVTRSSAEVVINTASIDTGVDEFDGHMKGGDLFDVANHPTATFKTTSVEKTGDDTLRLTGNLSIKGNTRPVTLAVKLNKTGQHFQSKKNMLGFSGRTSLMRSDFGMGYATPIVGDEVSIIIEVELQQAD